MNRVFHFAVGTALLLLLTGAERSSRHTSHLFGSPESHLTSTGTGVRFKAGAGPDTFCLYGGPGSVRGKFQHEDGTPVTLAELQSEPTTLAGEADGWLMVDLTDQPTFWQIHTFNMANLNSNGPGNHGMWAGRDASQEPGWASAPGYGNNWNTLLTWRTTDIDPGQGQTVSLDFFYNLDSEAGFDFFQVEVDSAGSTVQALSLTGTTATSGGIFSAPGTAANLSLPFQAGGYGNGNTEVVIRMAARSDAAYSDEDAFYDSDGLVQVDDITVTWSDATQNTATDTDRFEGADTGPNWTPEKAPFAGYFGKVFERLGDTDPCRENTTPVFAFLDDGTPPSNPGYIGTGTGGTTSVNWTYSGPAGWVVNYNGGVSGGFLDLENELITPPIAWDLPGPADDGVDVRGAFIRFSVWRHLPLFNGMFYTWHVRGRDSVTGSWGEWDNFDFFISLPGGDWLNVQNHVESCITTPNGPDGVQLKLSLRDLATVFAFPGTDATPSPYFDNVGFFKYRVGGPAMSTRTVDLFHDAFPQSGLSAHGTQAERDALDIRLDMARDISTGSQNVPGDSIILDITSIIPGSTIAAADISMTWALHTNPYFEDGIRANLTGGAGVGGAYLESVGTGYNGWDVWAGEEGVLGGGPVLGNNRYAFDLPDADFMYPGDIFEWYISATDDGGGTGGVPLTSTFPTHIGGFNDGDKHSYPRLHTVRALPTITAAGQPDILLVNDFGHRGAENEYDAAFGQMGLEEGARASSGVQPAAYDRYTVRGASSGIGNGIGSAGAHGANGAQLAGYGCIVYVSGNLSAFLLSNGTDVGLNDKGDDIGTLTAWQNQVGDRSIVYFGDGIATSTSNSSLSYLNNVMGVSFNDSDVSAELGGILAPLVRPNAAGAAVGFDADWVAYGGCPYPSRFDSIDAFAPGATNYVSHQFHGGSIALPMTAPAGVVHDRMEGGFRKVNVTFPFGFVYVYNGGSTGGGAGLSDRSVLLGEVLQFFNHAGVPGTDVVGLGDPTPARELSEVLASPNPFNPRTEFRFRIGAPGPVTVHIYNLAGRRVRSLATGEVFAAGEHRLAWGGADDDGVSVASGVYIARVEANGFTRRAKIALLK